MGQTVVDFFVGIVSFSSFFTDLYFLIDGLVFDKDVTPWFERVWNPYFVIKKHAFTHASF